MFFYIGPSCSLLDKVHDNLFLDKGWTSPIKKLWYKGYSTDCNLSENIDDILQGYQPRGIWCVIYYEHNQYKIFHPEHRGFYLFTDGNVKTNLPLNGFINDYHKPSMVINKSIQSFDSVTDSIKNILIENCTNFVKYNDDDLNLWCTGGIDSTSLLAVLETARIPYSLYVSKPKDIFISPADFEGTIKEYDSEFIQLLRNEFWGYEILSVFRENKTLVTGFYGDEFLCRGPEQINSIANTWNKTALDLVKSSDYMYPYLKKKESNLLRESLSDTFARQNILNLLTNDFQIWHLDETKTFCPYYDKRIIDLVLSLETDLLLNTVFDADIQKEIIRLCDANILSLVDTQKNTLNGRKNFVENLSSVKLNYCKNINFV